LVYGWLKANFEEPSLTKKRSSLGSNTEDNVVSQNYGAHVVTEHWEGREYETPSFVSQD